MERIDQILNHPLYLEYLQKIKTWEKDRIFCKHDMVHFLDVCRIAENLWLRFCLENKECSDDMNSDLFSSDMKEYIYATGLLHDIGRWQEYESGIRHEIASASLAESILKDSGFQEMEKNRILQAISNHRNALVKEEDSLSGWIYRADKRSRACFACEAQELCDWSLLKKNMKLM